MKYSICRFKPKSSFHLGTKEGWTEGTEKQIHSDTLFSAFCHNFLLLYGQKDLEEFLSLYQQQPPVLFSSVLKRIDDKWLFPVPLNQFPNDPDLRKISLIDLESFNIAINGKSIEQTLAENKNSYFQDDWKNPKISTYTTPRVTISAFTNTVVTEGDGFYQIGQVSFDSSVELYFLYKLSEDFPESKFQAVMRLMADEGIGGDRSVGKGVFQYPEFDSVEINTPENPNAFVSLSLYFPAKLPIQKIDTAFYNIISRKGYIYSPYEQNKLKKPCRMFTEASVFGNDTFDGGTLVDVTPDDFYLHKVYRYGIPLTIPCKLGKLEVENE